MSIWSVSGVGVGCELTEVGVGLGILAPPVRAGPMVDRIVDGVDVNSIAPAAAREAEGVLKVWIATIVLHVHYTSLELGADGGLW